MVLRARMLGEPEDVTLPVLSRSEVDELRRSHLEAQRHGEKLFSCVQCGGPLHPIRFRSGLDIFGHDPGAHETCVLARSGESVRHEMLKSVICTAAGRVAGFTAEVEVRGDGLDPGTGYPPVVDVVATNLADRSRHGWEVQLSAQTDALVYHRQEVRVSFLSQCSWETTGARPVWADHVPWLGLDLDGETWRVTGGLVVRQALPGRSVEYVPAGPEPLTRVVGDQLRPSRRRLSWVEAPVGGWARLAEHTGQGTARPRPQEGGLEHHPAESCDRPRIYVVPDVPALGAVLRQRSTPEEQPPGAPTWRPRANLPGLVPMSPAEHRRATAARRLVTAPSRRALMEGGPCGCTG
jgi:hypothetical protein